MRLVSPSIEHRAAFFALYKDFENNDSINADTIVKALMTLMPIFSD